MLCCMRGSDLVIAFKDEEDRCLAFMGYGLGQLQIWKGLTESEHFFVTFSNLHFNFRNFMSELTEDLQKSINHQKCPRN